MAIRADMILESSKIDALHTLIADLTTRTADLKRGLARLDAIRDATLRRVLEYRIDFGPGYRIYFGRDGETIIILLTGGTKTRQQRDIDTAHAFWQDYKRDKRGPR